MKDARRTCRYEGCIASIRKFHCAPHCDKILDNIYGVADTVYKEAAEVYIGRTSFPEQRLLAHYGKDNRKWLSILHWASCKEESTFFEEHLIAEFRDRAKGANLSYESIGRWNGDFNCIYIAWSRKSASIWTSEKDRLKLIETKNGWKIDDGNRLFPERPGKFRPLHLSCEGISEGKLLKAYENLCEEKGWYYEAR